MKIKAVMSLVMSLILLTSAHAATFVRIADTDNTSTSHSLDNTDNGFNDNEKGQTPGSVMSGSGETEGAIPDDEFKSDDDMTQDTATADGDEDY